MSDRVPYVALPGGATVDTLDPQATGTGGLLLDENDRRLADAVIALDAALAGKAAAAHTHVFNDVIGLQAALDAKASTAHQHTLNDVTDAGTAAARDVPAVGDAGVSEVVLGSDSRLTDSRSPTSHMHPIGDVTDLQTVLDGKAALVHTHDDRYYTEAETDALLAGKSSTGHTHTLADVTDAGTSASHDVPAAGNAAAGDVVLGSDTRLSDARTPTAHAHAIADTTGLQAALDGKVATASNVGTGHGLYKEKVGADLRFRTLTNSGGGLSIAGNTNTIDFALDVGLNLLNDVTVATPAEHNVLKRDAAGEWVNVATLHTSNIPDLSATYATAGHNHDATYAPISHQHNASDINAGTMATARLGSGTASNGKMLRGDSTWADIPMHVAVRLSSGNTTLLDSDGVILCNANQTITITPANLTPGRVFCVKRLNVGTITLSMSTGTIEGATSLVLNTGRRSVCFVIVGDAHVIAEKAS